MSLEQRRTGIDRDLIRAELLRFGARVLCIAAALLALWAAAALLHAPGSPAGLSRLVWGALYSGWFAVVFFLCASGKRVYAGGGALNAALFVLLGVAGVLALDVAGLIALFGLEAWSR